MENLQAPHLSLSILFCLIFSIYGQQVTTPCTPSMVTNFTPCFNFITGSNSNNNNPSVPSSNCCDSFKSILSTSMDCVCLLIAANVPFQPINRTLSLPRACNMSGFSLQCKASGSPLPAPGPVLLGPTLPPPASSPFSPQASKAVTLAPKSSEQLAPKSSPIEPEAPTGSKIRPVITPSSASNRLNIMPFVVLIIIGIMNFIWLPMCFY